MIKIAVLDDEQNEIELLKDHFKKLGREIHEELEVFEYTSGKMLLEENTLFDLYCLDIEMKEKDGIEIAKEIRTKDSQVLIMFITNMAQLAIKGYQVQAIDFVIKPVKYYSFRMKMKSIIHMINNQKSKNILVNTQYGFKKISTNQLYYAEIRGHYLFYHTVDGVFKQKGSMIELEKFLAGLSFRRCNNCYLVNLKYIDCVHKDELKIGGEWLKISRPRKKEFLQALTNYIGGIE